MKRIEFLTHKILSRSQAVQRMAQWRVHGKTIAFTNGVFDIMHSGHIHSLSAAAAEADFLVIGLNSDESVKRLKGEGRPVNLFASRALVLASMAFIDAVVEFPEDTPLELIKALKPDVLVKGGDYSIEQIAGANEVIAYGGKVIINPLIDGFSTTGIIKKIKNH